MKRYLLLILLFIPTSIFADVYEVYKKETANKIVQAIKPGAILAYSMHNAPISQLWLVQGITIVELSEKGARRSSHPEGYRYKILIKRKILSLMEDISFLNVRVGPPYFKKNAKCGLKLTPMEIEQANAYGSRLAKDSDYLTIPYSFYRNPGSNDYSPTIHLISDLSGDNRSKVTLNLSDFDRKFIMKCVQKEKAKKGKRK